MAKCRRCGNVFKNKKGLAVHRRVHQKPNQKKSKAKVGAGLDPRRLFVKPSDYLPLVQAATKLIPTVGKEFVDKINSGVGVNVQQFACLISKLVKHLKVEGILNRDTPTTHQVVKHVAKGGFIAAAAARILPVVARLVLQYLPTIARGALTGAAGWGAQKALSAVVNSGGGIYAIRQLQHGANQEIY